MIDQTIPLPELVAGMARCVREWILPHLDDPMARGQAEQLAALLEALPGALAPEAVAAIRTDTRETRAFLAGLADAGRAGAGTPPPGDAGGDAGGGVSVDAALRENSAARGELERVIARLRGDAASAGVDAVQARTELARARRFLVDGLRRELARGRSEGTDFASMAGKDRATSG